jgi:predicted transcriptional regulator
MTRRATTFRIDEVSQEGLSLLSKLSGRSSNQLVNEAIKEFVAKRSLEIEDDLKATLADLRAYRLRDPNFDAALAKAAEIEASVTDDPAEGKVVTETEPLKVRLRGLLDG